jgi:hypothetical protein
MANYYATFRTNYFKVKDLELFKTWVNSLSSEDNIEIFENDEDGSMVGFGAYSGIPTSRTIDDDDVEINFTKELSKHLADGEVAIIMEAGSEKLRYVIGLAIAVTSEGKTKAIDLCDIYTWAKKKNNNITTCEY